MILLQKIALNPFVCLFQLQENIEILCQELKSPKYGSYFIYFSNMIDKNSIEKLAHADDYESVREIKVS